MHHRFLLLAIVSWIASSGIAAHAASPCIHADIGIDARHTMITLQLTLPRDSQDIALKSLDGYQRGHLWRSPDGSAVVTDGKLAAADPQHPRLRVTMDVRSNLDRPDRTYPPFLRFSDGTVAVDTDTFATAPHTLPLCLRFVPAAGEQVVGFGQTSKRSLMATSAPVPAAYVAFGTPRVERFHALMMVSDRRTPDWIRQRLHVTIPGIVAFYRQRMRPMAVPTVFLYQLAGTQKGSGYHGDRLPGSVTLGLIGDSWSKPDAGAAHQITHFVAHEMFHVWNAGDGLVAADDESNLASEGGAEMASIFATASVEGHGASAWLDAASTSLDNCLIALPDSGSLAAGHLDHGQLPYDCGVPMMLVIAALSDPNDPSAGYFRAWNRLIDARRTPNRARYRWTDLLPTDAAAAAARAMLDRAVHGDRAYAPSIRRALELAGFVLKPQQISAGMRARMNMPLMAALMASDCAGRISFWTHPDGFVLDQPLPECRTLAAGKKVVRLLGQSLAIDQPQALAAAIRARCAAGGRLDVGYADGSSSSPGCPAKPVTLPSLWQIAGYAKP